MGSFLSGVTGCRVGLPGQGGAGTEGQRPGQWRLGHHGPAGPLKKSDTGTATCTHMCAHTGTWEDEDLAVKESIYSQIMWRTSGAQRVLRAK